MNLDQAIAKVKTSSEPNASHAELFVRALASLGVLSLDAPMNGFQKVCDGLGGLYPGAMRMIWRIFFLNLI